MKTTRRILAVLLAVMMIAAMMVPASAATALPDTATVTINNALAGTTYTLYRVFNLSATDGSTLNSYITSSNWDSVVRGTAYSSYVTVTGTGVGSVVTPASGFNTPAMAQAFAAQIVTDKGAIANDGTLTVGTSGSNSFSPDLQYGYYVMVSSRAGATKYTTFTLNKNTGVTIDEKNPGYPDLAKKVSDDAGVTFKSGVSADFGTELKYEITLEAAAGTHAADPYTIKDTLPTGVTLRDTSVVVKLIKKVGGAESTLVKDTDYTLTTSTSEFTVELKETVRNGLADGDKIVISYIGTLNTGATLDAANTNTAEITCLKNGSSTTLTAKANVFTSSLSFDKFASDTGTYVAGAKFVVTKEDGGTKYALLDASNNLTGWTDDPGAASVITTAGANIVVKGLDAGTYTLVEKEAPAGYIKAADTAVTITATADAEGNVTAIAKAANVVITNVKGTQLPETGGMGTTIFYVVGVVLVLGAVVVLTVKRRKSAQ